MYGENIWEVNMEYMPKKSHENFVESSKKAVAFLVSLRGRPLGLHLPPPTTSRPLPI